MTTTGLARPSPRPPSPWSSPFAPQPLATRPFLTDCEHPTDKQSPCIQWFSITIIGADGTKNNHDWCGGPPNNKRKNKIIFSPKTKFPDSLATAHRAKMPADSRRRRVPNGIEKRRPEDPPKERKWQYVSDWAYLGGIPLQALTCWIGPTWVARGPATDTARRCHEGWRAQSGWHTGW